MKIKYDLHIHSCLSPCAENEMTPVTIVGYAALNGVNMVAIADHNAIENVEVAMKAGEAYGVTVVPAIELQTAEDVHIVCLFRTFDSLKAFYDSVDFPHFDNDKAIFGDEYIMDEDDNVIGELDRLLLTSSTMTAYEVKKAVASFGGYAFPAHIDREGNGMVAILGSVTNEWKTVELSTKATLAQCDEYSKQYIVLIDSDAHTLEGISLGSEMELKDNSIDALFDYLISAEGE